MAQHRIKLLRNKKTNELQRDKRELAELVSGY